MVTKPVLLSVLLVVGMTTSAFSQGEYLDRSQSEFGVGTGIVNNENGSGIGASVSYNGSGDVEVVISVSRVGFVSSFPSLYNVNRKVSGTAYSIEFLMHVVREDSMRVPFSISLTVESELSWYSAQGDYYHMELFGTGGDYTYGIDASKEIYLTTSTYVRPSIGFNYLEGFNLGSAGSIESDRLYLLTGFIRTAYSVKTSETETLLLEPAVTFNKNGTTFLIGVGIVFGKVH